MKITPQGFAVMDDNRDSVLSRWCENEGLCHDVRVRKDYCQLIPIGGVVIDAGAAIGDHTVAYLDKVGQMGTVYAFEPNPEMFQCLQYNCPAAFSYEVALGIDSGFGFMVNNSRNAGASFVERANHLSDGLAFAVKIVALDKFITLEKLDFLKLDIEGMETEALKGATETIMRCRPVIVTEVNHPVLNRRGTSFDEIKSVLDELKYTYRIFLGEEESSQFELIAEPMVI